MKSILFYVSGHGFGHARRMTQVIRALAEIAPDIGIHVRTAAPPRVFDPIPSEQIKLSEIDSGMVEAGALAINRNATLEHLEQFVARSHSIVSGEVNEISSLRPSLIVADIPFLAGDVAGALGVPCVGISNFTWDWIYQSIFGDEPRYGPIHQRIVRGYGWFSTILQLPFGKTCDAIARTIPMPLIAPRSNRPWEQVLAQLGISSSDNRSRVLFATRGGIPPETLLTVSGDCPQMLFLTSMELNRVIPSNVKSFHLSSGLDFSDVLAICDVVISKLGYGIVAECIAARVRLLWPRRNGFVEDQITERELPRYVPTREIGIDEYTRGNWGSALRELMRQPLSRELMAVNGAERCAKWILDSL